MHTIWFSSWLATHTKGHSLAQHPIYYTIIKQQRNIGRARRHAEILCDWILKNQSLCTFGRTLIMLLPK